MPSLKSNLIVCMYVCKKIEKINKHKIVLMLSSDNNIILN